MELLEFQPSEYYAFVTNVNYTMTIQPSHDCFPSTRIILTMPENLKFDQDEGCKVYYIAADCELFADRNEIMLTNVFSERTPGGTKIRFIISNGDNPIGARYAGDWGARTERIFDGEYYTVDGNQEGNSFFALPGWIKSDLSYTGDKTFSYDSLY